jgi:hypothetical protein
MQEVRLSVRKRAFPSQGRVRFNIAHLTDLGILEGERVDLINESTKKTITTTFIADTMVRQGQVRMSEEDLKILGLQDDEDVLIRKSPSHQEKIKKAAADANIPPTKRVDKPDHAGKKASGEGKTVAKKTADSLKKEMKNTSDKIRTAVKRTRGNEKAKKNSHL